MRIAMKRIFSIIVALLFVMHAFPQSNNIYTDGTKWIYVYDAFDPDGFWFRGDVIVETIKGDTVVNGITYKKIERAEIYIGEEEDYDPITRGDLLRYSDSKYLRYYTDISYGEDYKNAYPQKFMGDDHVMYDENLKVGDKVWWEQNQTVVEIGDTVFEESPNVVRKYWRHNAGTDWYYEEDLYTRLNHIWWIEGIGRLSYPYYIGVDCICHDMLMCCINANGDTIYKNKKYVEAVKDYIRITGMRGICADNISIAQHDGECIVTLPVAAEWAVTLYNAAGVSVACKAGEGSEIFLPVDGKGTHILVLEVGGKQYTKKVMIR